MNLFVVFTPYQKMVVESILEQHDWVSKGNNLCFSFVDEVWHNKNLKVIYFSNQNFISKFFSVFKYKFICRKYLKNKRDVNLFISHPIQVIANNLYFSKYVSKKYLFEEGVLNYYEAKVKGPFKKIMDKNHKLAKIVGLNYVRYEGLIVGPALDDYSGVFAFDEKHLFTMPKNGGFYKLNANYDNKSKLGEGVLILDQPIEQSLSSIEIDKLWQALLSYVKSCKTSVIYYKKHPSAESNLKNLNLSGIKVIEIKSNQPVEQLVSQLPVFVTVSFICSALSNIKALNSEIECVSIGANLIREKSPNDLTGLVNYFKSKNIKMISV